MPEKTPKNWPDVWIAWAGVFKSIGIKALVSGKFWQFCFLCVVLAFAYRIESDDWVQIFSSVLASQVVSVLGWLFAVFFAIAGAIGLRLQRSIFLAEIDRLAGQRTELQKQLSKGSFASSIPDAPAAIPAMPALLEGENA